MDEEHLRQRAKNAIILLTDGHPFRVGDLTLSCKDNKHLSVTGWTLCNEIKNLTKQKALQELNEIKNLFTKMLTSSQELCDFANDRKVEYHLADDYGMGSIEICSELNGQIKWSVELK